MLLKEFKDLGLNLLSTAMGDVPKFGFEFVVSSLTLPCLVHSLEGFLDAGHREKLILRAVDE